MTYPEVRRTPHLKQPSSCWKCGSKNIIQVMFPERSKICRKCGAKQRRSR